MLIATQEGNGEMTKIPVLNAHALGGWHGRTYVNSREAFLAAYRRGFRHFEVDISCTSDGCFVAKHGGGRLHEHYSKDEFLSNSRWNEHRLTLEDIVALMVKYTSIEMMFDFHPCLYDLDCPDEMRRFLSALPEGEIRSRCLVESYSVKNMLPVIEDGRVVPIFGWQAHTFPEGLLACGKWCVVNNVRRISVPSGYCMEHPDEIRTLKEQGMVLYSCGWRNWRGLKFAASIGIDVATVDFLVPGGRMRNWFMGYLARGIWQKISFVMGWIDCGGTVRSRCVKPMTLEEVHAMNLTLLKYFHKFCEDRGLKYFLAYGTLLGAVRHKGPIPWDDDVDIYMPRPDYEKFCKAFPNSLRYCLFSPLRGNTLTAFSRLCEMYSTWMVGDTKFAGRPTGVVMDIFPLDGASADIEEHNRRMKAYEPVKRRLEVVRLRLRRIFPRSGRRKGWLLLFLKSHLVYPFMVRSWLRQASNMQRREQYDSASFVTNFCDNDGRDRLHMPKSWFSERVLLEYEDTHLYAPVGYDEYLTNYYGDYMIPPAGAGGQHRSHGKAFWLT